MSQVLSHRWVSSAQRVSDAEAPVVFVLHGALGSGQNFRRFVQSLHSERSEYRYLLIDLRCHGDSQGMPPPHTLKSCADDLDTLARELGVFPSVVMGHSFGGKVALQYAHSRERAGDPSPLAQVWLLDSVPGAQPVGEDSEVSHVIRAVRKVPMPALARRDVVQHLLAEQGLSPGLSEWMATNLRRVENRYEWKFDLDGIEELMADYFRVDLWDYLAEVHSPLRIELVVAERSDRWTPAMRARAGELAASSGVRCHHLGNSGHWVHVDNSRGLLSILREHLV